MMRVVNDIFRQHLHGWRLLVQTLSLFTIVFLPVLGVFRVDILTGCFVVMGYQIWFSDFFIVFGLWVFLAGSLVMTYSVFGSIFCGWICPQGFVSELATKLMRRTLGRQATLNPDGTAAKIALRKRGMGNILILSGSMLFGAMLFALVPMLYFYPPSAVWHFLMFQPDASITGSIYWIYFIFTVVMLLDIAFIRHLMCRYMCVYRIWQHSFKTHDTLRIGYDESRSETCINCGYCAQACVVDLDPRHTETYSGCTACGECIVACDHLHARKQEDGLLSFAFPELASNAGSLTSKRGRIRGVLPVLLASGAMFLYGVLSYDPYHFSVGKSMIPGAGLMDYVVHIANKRERPASVDILVQGVSADAYHLGHERVSFDTAGIMDVPLHFKPRTLKTGLHHFTVTLKADDGWKKDFKALFFIPGRSDH